MDRTEPLVLMAATKWWALSARLASALHRHGCEVKAVCPTGHPLTHIASIRHIYRYRGIFSMASLRRAMHECRPDIVIPCDDGVVMQLHALHALDPTLRPLIGRSLGPPENYGVVESRDKFMRTALELGIRVPKTRKVVAADDIVEWHASGSTSTAVKLSGECGGNGVRISHSLAESLEAWQDLRRPRSVVTAWKRLVIDRDPLAVWMGRRHREREVTIQEFVTGRPANSMLVCWRGKLLSVVSVFVVASDGPTGAATIVRVVHNEKMQEAAEKVVSRLKLSGFYGLDFIIESGTGVPFLIEMNPRCTQLGHLELPGEGCLAGVLSAVLRGEPRPQAQNPIPGDKIALFPQALAAGSACRPYIDACYHDMPSEEPKLMSELLLKSWPQRQWAARMYHAFKPIARTEPATFEDIDSFAPVRQ